MTQEQPRVKIARPVESAFKTTADYYAAIIRYRIAQMERKGSECIYQSCYGIYNEGRWLEGNIRSFEKSREGVWYAVRIYYAPTDRRDTMVIDRDFLPFESECMCVDQREQTDLLPKVCQAWGRKANALSRPTVTRPDSCCIHSLALYRDYCLGAKI